MAELRNGWVIQRDTEADGGEPGPWWDGNGWTHKQINAIYMATEMDALKVSACVLIGIATHVAWIADRRFEGELPKSAAQSRPTP